MHTSSVDVGTLPVLQLAAVNQLPLPFALHESVQPLACAATGIHASPARSAAASAVFHQSEPRVRAAVNPNINYPPGLSSSATLGLSWPRAAESARAFRARRGCKAT